MVQKLSSKLLFTKYWWILQILYFTR